MSYRWMYIVILLVVVSYLRYIAYKRSKRVEEKVDLILETLGVGAGKNGAGDAKSLPVGNKETKKENPN